MGRLVGVSSSFLLVAVVVVDEGGVGERVTSGPGARAVLVVSGVSGVCGMDDKMVLVVVVEDVVVFAKRGRRMKVVIVVV